MSNNIKKDLINWNAEQLSDDSPVYNSKDLINALNSIMPSLGSVILTTNNHVLSKQEDWDSITMNTLNMFTTLANSGLPANDFPSNSGVLLVLGYTSYNIYIAISGTAVYYRLGGADWNKLLTSETIKDLTDNVTTLTNNLSKLSDQQTTLSSLFNTFKDDTTKQLDTLNSQSTSQAKLLEDINNQLLALEDKIKDELGKLKERVDNSYLEALTLSMTYNPNDTTRYTKILGLYSGLNTPITLVNMVNVDSNTGSVLTPTSDEDLQKAITNAVDKGYKITMLKPHLGPNYNDGFKKFGYMPDDVDLFFKNYKKVLLSQAKLASANSIPILSIADELNLLVAPKYLGQWTDIINDIRNAYPNLKLTIAAASPFKTDDQTLFPYLDYIGINWYPSYANKLINSSSDLPSEAQLSQVMMTNHSNDMLNEMAVTDVELFMEMARKYNKPIWITETGVMPKPDGLAQMISNSGASDIYDVPAAAMNAFVHTIGQMGPVVGINWWHAQSPFNLAPEDGDGSTTVAMQTWANLLKEVNND